MGNVCIISTSRCGRLGITLALTPSPRDHKNCGCKYYMPGQTLTLYKQICKTNANCMQTHTHTPTHSLCDAVKVPCDGTKSPTATKCVWREKSSDSRRWSMRGYASQFTKCAFFDHYYFHSFQSRHIHTLVLLSIKWKMHKM